jgi:branched-chain amino acid transport system substrate-binding protein
VVAAAPSLAAATEGGPITIGLFVPTRGEGSISGMEAVRGAQVAVDAVNRSGGISGRPLRIAAASSDLRWEAAAGDLVRLLYEEGAVAVVGGLDGRSAHLAEQVITRARGRAVFLTPWAGEATLTQIRIPWFFRLVPDDRIQAAALAEAVFARSGAGDRSVAVWVEDSLDARSAADALARVSPADRVVWFREGSDRARRELVERIRDAGFEAVVLLGSPRAAAGLARALAQRRGGPALYGPIQLAAPEFLREAGDAADGMILAIPGGSTGSAEARVFEREFRTRHGASPGLLAACTHDAILAVAQALRAARLDPALPLAEALARGSIPAATGRIRFDKNRSREGAAGLAIVRDGRLVPLPRAGAVPGPLEATR